MVLGRFVTRYKAESPIKHSCFSCGDTFMKNRGRSSYLDRYQLCSDCKDRFMRRPTGTMLQGLDFTRELVRIRDNHTCQESEGGCGKVWKHGERRFDIHHLDGKCGRFSRSYDRVSSMDILVTLCHRCHLNLPEVLEKMINKSSPRPDKPKWNSMNKN